MKSTATRMLLAVGLLASLHPRAHSWARADSDSSGWELQSVGGSLTQTGQAYLQKVSGFLTFQGRTDAELTLGATHPDWGVTLVPWATVYEPYAVAASTEGQSQAKAYLDLKEGWLEYRGVHWDLRLGNQTLAWGAADRVNPTDLWNSYDLTDPFSLRKLPTLTAKAGIHPLQAGGWALDLYASPFFREPRLPVELPSSGANNSVALSLGDSRWLFPFPDRLALAGTTVPLKYRVGAPTFPDQRWQAAARLRGSPIDGWDFSLTYQNAVERMPRFKVAAAGDASDPALPITVTLSPSYHREHLFGADASGSILSGRVTLRMEGAYHLPMEEGFSQAVHLVAGADYTLPWKLLGIVTYLNAMGVLYEEIGIDRTLRATHFTHAPRILPWDRNAILLVQNRITPRWKLDTVVIGSFENQDAILSPTLSARLGDYLQASLGADFFLGDPEGFFGQFYDNQRVRGSVTIAF